MKCLSDVRVRPLFAVLGLALGLTLLVSCTSKDTPPADDGDTAGSGGGGSEKQPIQTASTTSGGGTANDPEPAEPVLGTAAPVTFDPPLLDLGTGRPGDKFDGAFSITNQGDEPLTVKAFRADCACTSFTDLTDTVIAPGETVPMPVKVRGRVIPGPVKAGVKIIFAGYTEVTQYDITATVVRAITVIPNYFDCETADRSLRGIVTLEADQPFNILSANGAPPRYIGFDPDLHEARSVYQLRWDLNPYYRNGKCAEMPRFWVVETDHPEVPVLDIIVRHECTLPDPLGTRKWIITQPRLNLGSVRAGESRELEFRIARFEDEKVYQVVPMSERLDARLVRTYIDGQDTVCVVEITPRGDSGLLYDYIEIVSAAHSARMLVIGSVKDGATAAAD